MSSFLTKVIRNSLTKRSALQSLNYITVRRSSLWEPDYLAVAKQKPPVFDLINFQIKGYDFVTVEKYQSLIHKLALKVGLDVRDSWSTPCKDIKVTTFRPKTSNTVNEFFLHEYERNVQISYVESYKLSLLIDLAVTTCPPGVKVSVHKHLKEMEDIRYVPDLEVIQLEEKLKEMNNKNVKKS